MGNSSTPAWLRRLQETLTGVSIASAAAWLAPVVLFWVLFQARIPASISRSLSTYTPVLFLAVLLCFCLSFKGDAWYFTLASLGLTMLLFGLTVSFQQTSGYTDTAMIGGLLPYKDAKNYYHGALQILNGLPLRLGVQAVRRPLFPGMLAATLPLAGMDFRLVLAILSQVTGLSLYFASRTVRRSFGWMAAGVFTTLMYFFIQPKVGYSVSEMPGFMLGCWAFCILWAMVPRRNWTGIVLGLAMLMAAISTRAGAFFIFAALIPWAGWAFRGEHRFSWKSAAVMAAVVIGLYLAENQLFSRLLDIDPTDQWASFAYAMYGQVHGGTGWHSAIEDLQTTRASVVGQAALQFFLAHPLSFFIAAAKSYRDFFVPGPFTIYAFGEVDEPAWVIYPLWATTSALLILGLVRAWRARGRALASLMLACFAGIVLSIPFLPPIDSGARFQAGSMGFYFVLAAAALARPADWHDPGSERPVPADVLFVSGTAIVLLVLNLIVPVLIYRLTPAPAVTAPVCDAGSQPFVIRAYPGSYIDVLAEPGGTCGYLPEVCLADFDRRATDKTNDDFVQALISMARSEPGGLRITAAMNLTDARFHYFVSPVGEPLAADRQLASGCAAETLTRNESIFKVGGLTSAP